MLKLSYQSSRRKQPKTLSGIETIASCLMYSLLSSRKQPKTLSGIETRQLCDDVEYVLLPKTT